MPESLPRKSTSVKPRLVNLFTPSRLDLAFIFEAAKGLCFRVAQNEPAHLENRREIPATFAAFSLAVPQDDSAASAAMERVKDLGVHAVRIDYSKVTDEDVMLRLLQSLREAGVSVLLHLVQPLRQAQQMPDDASVAQWRRFVERAMELFPDYVEAVEIGTTINRAKWSGYSLAGFLSAWETAYPIIKKVGLPVVGPNVTDFEPQYNAGVLGLLKRRAMLPDIHSNNMFAERAIEPEALDRKILGDAFKRLHGYDLIKKLSLVARLGRHYGIPRNWSTCAFWTLPRIERILDNAEEQKADYLVRYYVLCVSEGSFERLYWGPLVSRREGLMDDGTGLPEDRSIRDIVAYYRELPGESSQWRCRPSYGAFKTVYNQLLGARYLRRLCSQDRLEVHAFEKGDEVFHVVWTRNGALARSSQVYSPEHLSELKAVVSRNGTQLDKVPEYFTESPIYLVWRRETVMEVLEGASAVPQVVASRPIDGYHYYDCGIGQWQGMVRARSREEADRLSAALKPDAIGSPTAETTMRKARNAIWTVEDPLHAGQSLVVKKPVRVAWHKRILDRKKPSKSLRSWNGTSELQRRGIETPKVVAYFEHQDSAKVLDNWFICEHANTRLSVRGFFSAYARGEETVEGYTFEIFAEQLIDFIRTVHWRGVYFRDLSAGNVLVRIEVEKRLVFSLIDTARARFANQRFSRSRRVADLKRLVHKLDAERQEYFMRSYLQKERARFTGWHRFTFKMYALKASLKRVKRKARKQLTTK